MSKQAKKEGKKQERKAEPKKQEHTSKDKIKESKSSETTSVPEPKVQSITETLQRLQAEFDNYKKRTEQQNSNFIKHANQEIIKDLLPIIDNFELALRNCKEKDEFYKGIELIYSQINELLKNKGVTHIKCEGEKFDPYYHEALLTEESDKEEGTILEELQKGYLLNEKVIRHSKVKVAKKSHSGD